MNPKPISEVDAGDIIIVHELDGTTKYMQLTPLEDDGHDYDQG